jgi:hypothetical protein
MSIVAAGILGIVNAVIHPVVLILTLPINLLRSGSSPIIIRSCTACRLPGPGFIVRVWRRSGAPGHQPGELGPERLRGQ